LDDTVCPVEGREFTSPDPGDPDDSTLLALASSGDRQALEALCRRNWRPVYRSVARYAADPGEAEDLTQEVFLRALRAFPQFADTGVPYAAYLMRIAANLTRDRWRARPGRVVPVGNLPEQPTPGPGPDGLAVARDQRAILLSALDRLRPDQRAVLRLRILEGRTTAEVAALTNRSAAAVRQLQVRALHALRVTLAEQASEMITDFGRD
jgi:RNA polymerase sigma-70 factor (ECF subfamily)